jgi:hypothetical protein
MTGEQCFEDLILRDDLRPAFNHHNGIATAGEKYIEVAFVELGLRRVHHPFATHAANAHPDQRPVERNV